MLKQKEDLILRSMDYLMINIRNYFAEIFYPPKLKALICTLRRTDDLDQLAHQRMNGFVVRRLLWPILTLGIAVPLVLILTGQSIAIIAAGFVTPISLYILFTAEMKRLLSRYPILYSDGALAHGRVLTYYEPGLSRNRAWGLTYTFYVGSTAFQGSSGDLTTWLWSERFAPGDHVLICYDPYNPELSAPITSRLFSLFHLKQRADAWQQRTTTPSQSS